MGAFYIYTFLKQLINKYNFTTYFVGVSLQVVKIKQVPKHAGIVKQIMRNTLRIKFYRTNNNIHTHANLLLIKDIQYEVGILHFLNQFGVC